MRKGCGSTLDTKVSAMQQDYAPIRPMEEEFQKLHATVESERTPEQAERHAELLIELTLTDKWTVLHLTDSEMNSAFHHHVKQYNK
jgi:hypothetical protein